MNENQQKWYQKDGNQQLRVNSLYTVLFTAKLCTFRQNKQKDVG